MRSPVTAITTTKNTIENGKPNRKRILVAPQVPSGPVSERCMALRATCPSAAVMVKGIQSEVMVNMGEVIPAGESGHRAGRGRCGQLKPRHDRIAREQQIPLSSLRKQGGGFTLEVQHLGKGLGRGSEVKAFARSVVVGGDKVAEPAV